MFVIWKINAIILFKRNMADLWGAIRVRILQRLDAVAFWSWNLNVVVIQSWNLNVAAFCPLKKCLGITMYWFSCLFLDVMVFSPRELMSQFFGPVISMSLLFGLRILMLCICASTASFSFSLNLLCHIINVSF